MVGEIDKGSSPDRNQHIGAQSGTSLPVLPFSTNQRPQHEGGEQADQRVQEVEELKSLQKSHEKAFSLCHFAAVQPLQASARIAGG